MAVTPAAGRNRICGPASNRMWASTRMLLRKNGAYPRAQVTFVLFFLACCLPNLLAYPVKPIRRVVILNEVGVTYPLIDLIDQGIRNSLSDSPYQIDFYREYMETALFPEPADQQLFRDFYIRRYQNRRPDVIIAVGPSPLKFMIETHQRFFRGIPVVFCLPNRLPGYSITDPDFTGIESDIAPGLTLAAALHLVPGTKHVVVLGGTAPYDRGQQDEVKEQLKTYQNRLDISYLTDLSLPSLLEQLKQLPSHTIILLTPIGRDATGKTFKSSEIGPLVVSAANAPVFSLTDRYINHGEVGGDISSGIEQGELAGKMAVRLLNGENPKAISHVSTMTNYRFDWKALKRWDLKEKNLPPGSIILNRPPTVWELYQWYIIIGTSLILIEGILISGLIWQHARRCETNRALEKRTTESQAREELLKIFVKNVPAGVAMLDRDMRYLQVSDRWCADYGVDASHILGRSHYEALPDMPDRWREVHRRALEGETLRADEERWDRKSGTTWLRWEVRPWLNVDGKPGGILIFAEEITRRKQADEALSSMSRKLIESQEQERSRIARELHDDINQRLALLAVELDRFDQSGSTKDLHAILQESKRRVIAIATGVQALSHQLHSSKLEYLGLAAAVKSFCKEISEMHNVRIDFTQNGVPRNLPQQVELCLFRVLQEALRNAVKYSGTDHFEVDLFGRPADIRLRVRDFGQGFRVEDAMKSKGLGLVSMRERVNLVNGEIVIKSKPMAGTEITVHVPVPTADRASGVSSGAA
jgi:PAS domain S-box-containing protein